MKYITHATSKQELNDYLTELIKNANITKGVMKGSFVQKMYFPEAK